MFALLLTLACTAKDTATVTDSPTASEAGTTDTTPTTACDAPAPQVVTLQARDGVELVADLYVDGTDARPGVVLLHMIPPNYDRSDWPRSFIDALTARCWNVIAVDRRGAGDSGGVARDAYTGDAGRTDVEAAVKALQGPAGTGLGALAIIGASNGTTSMIDYAVWAGGEGLPAATALGFMTGGTYTESQTAMSSVTDLPAIFTYATAERDWSVEQQALDPGSWSFQEYADGDHGTKMFAAEPSVAADLEAFLAEHL